MNIKTKYPLLLASASPRRREILTTAGYTFEVSPADVDEHTVQAADFEDPADYVAALAELKARAVAENLEKEALVLGSDTVVVLPDEAGFTVLGKPADKEDAVAMLLSLSGRAHYVYTGVCIAECAGEEKTYHSFADCCEVVMNKISEEEAREYVEGGEPMDKAGAYAIQGEASVFVNRINGNYSTVVGLPIALIYSVMKREGLV